MKIDGSADQPLRWKAKPISQPMRSVANESNGPSEVKLATGYSAIGSGAVQASATSEVPAKTAGGWNKMRVDTYVTPAQAVQPDPFQDPFGDRRATQASALQLQPPGTNNPPNTNQPGFNPANPGFNPAVPAPNPRFQPFQPAPAPAPAPNPLPPAPTPNIEAPPVNPLFPPANEQPTPMPPAPMPAPMPENTQPERRQPMYPERRPMAEDDAPPTPMPGIPDVRPRSTTRSSSDLPCNRIYNDLNCCDTDSSCRAFVQSLVKDRLNRISLDISPRLQPDKDDAENAKARADRARLSGSRDWYRRGVGFDQRGENEPIARGRLVDMQHGRAIIKEESGEQRQIPLYDLSEDDLCFISGWWNLPAECALAGTREIDLYNRGWQPSTMTWTASALCHKPLYFEQVQHERYGHSAGPFRQPWIDGAHFFGSAILLPYKMALDPPWECEYDLGYYRPGSCAPYHIPPFPFSPRAAMAQAGFVVGGIYIMP